ncbi:DUF4191 domain-containing protein [Micropruina sonneratiae]|uniref:DUF4191 domain-containing protein n=1 Tax=Micropruina sonneratiae TaxID=2986940 RepID=UPI002227B87D|nr:DUF4191 domain-containing protein [Micropruina sp. KQZ13P-5]MCW3156819.1 DUF4191 domain-containing protein [Micropruina sp. KQZ13P-5]
MASDKAKELAAKQKAERRAEKLRKKNSDDPRDWGRVRQIIEAYKRTNEIDPELKWWTLAATAGPVLLCVLLGLWLQPWWLWLITGLMFALVGALYVLTWRVKKANYKRYEGQAGSSEVALQLLNKRKWTYELGIAATRQMDVVHRVVGPPGVVLIAEGTPARARALLGTEAKKHEQVAYGVPVTQVMVGKDQGQVPLDHLQKHLEKLPKAMQPQQLTEVKQRLRALDAMRPKMPVPRGPMPTMKGVNRAMRGR